MIYGFKISRESGEIKKLQRIFVLEFISVDDA